jgi:hypothetical protein
MCTRKETYEGAKEAYNYLVPEVLRRHAALGGLKRALNTHLLQASTQVQRVCHVPRLKNSEKSVACIIGH